MIHSEKETPLCSLIYKNILEVWRFSMKRRTYEEIEKIVNDRGHKLVKEYISEKGKHRLITQDENGYEYDTGFNEFLRNEICWVGKNNKSTVKNISLWLYLNRPEFEILTDNIYEGSHKNLNFYHTHCKEFFQMSLSNVCRGQNCPVCCGQQVGIKTSLAYKRPDLVKEWHPDNIKSPEQVTCGSHEKIYWICSICGYGKNKEWNAVVKSRTLNNRGCPKCSFSKGEDRIEKFLFESNINYKSQKSFHDCRDKDLLKFDFGIPYDDGSWKCIEHQGEQHFFPVDFAGKGIEWAKQQFKELKKRDKIKVKYCKDNNIPLLIIPYWDFDNIEQILSDALL